MDNVEVVLLKNVSEYERHTFVVRIIGEKDRLTGQPKIAQRVFYVENYPVGDPPIFPICAYNMNFNQDWNDCFYTTEGEVVGYKSTFQDAINDTEVLARQSAGKVIERVSSEGSKSILTDKLSIPTGSDPNPNYRFWYTRVWFPQI